MSKHTKTLWIIADPNPSDNISIRYITTETSKVIAKVMSGYQFDSFNERPDFPRSEAIANARLIAAAPDMFNFVNKVAAFDIEDWQNSYEAKALLASFLKQAKEFAAKTEGGAA